MGLTRLKPMTSDTGTQDNIEAINEHAISSDAVTETLAAYRRHSFDSDLTSNTDINSTYRFKTIPLDASGGSFTATLKSGSLTAGDWFRFKDVTGDNIDNPITIDGDGDTIDGASSISLSKDFEYIEITWDGTEFLITTVKKPSLQFVAAEDTISTTSTSFILMDDMTITAPGVGWYLATFACTYSNNNANSFVSIGIYINDVLVTYTDYDCAIATASENHQASIIIPIQITDSSHDATIKYKGSTGTSYAANRIFTLLKLRS